MATKFPFIYDPRLTAIAVMFQNKRLIADAVSPRIQVGLRKFAFTKWDVEQGFTIPDTKVGRRGELNEVNFDATRETGEVDDFGLIDRIPSDDIANAPENVDPEGNSTAFLTNLVLLERELTVANQVFNPANYATDYKQTLAGTDQFSDFDNSSPITVLTAALDSMIMRGNRAVMGRQVWNKVSQHPDVVKAAHGNSGDKGIAARQAVADLLELEAIDVGDAWVNTAKPGQTPVWQRCWGKHIALYYQDMGAQMTETQMSAFFTAQYKERIAGSEFDKKIGLRGGQEVRAGESRKEVVTSDMLGYLIEDAVA